MYQKCLVIAGQRNIPYCSCKYQVMKKEVSKFKYALNERNEGYRIVDVSTGQCVSRLR